MWFGDKVTCSTAEDMWLNEGWASFCEIIYLEDIYSHESYLKTMRHEHAEVLRAAHKKDGGYHALNNIPQEHTYGEHAYHKGATVTNTLRGYLGDSVFYDAMTAYLEHFAWQSVSSKDMRDFLTEYTGLDMTAFFDAWVFTPGTPHFSIDSTRTLEIGAGYLVDIYLKQKYKGAEFLADNNILEIAMVDQHSNFHIDTVHFSGKTGHSAKSVFFKPKAIFLDPFEKINDATTDNFHFFTETGEHEFPDTYCTITVDELPDSALFRVTHNWAAPDSLKTPVEGLRISTYRYWEIEGIVPDGIKAKGSFYYDRNSYLDEDLILSDSDSAVILFRENSSEDWREITQSRFGIWNMGLIYVEDLKPGQYTMAVWDTHLDITSGTPFNNEIKIYPNPSRGILNFSFPEKGKYTILLFDAKGAKLDQFTINGRKKTWKWQGDQAFSGVVFVHVYEGNELLTIRKLIFTH
jgi:aminopeptidase N